MGSIFQIENLCSGVMSTSCSYVHSLLEMIFLRQLFNKQAFDYVVHVCFLTFITYIYLLGVRVDLSQHAAYGGQRTSCESLFAPSTTWTPGIKLMLSSLAASIFTGSAFHWPCFCLFISFFPFVFVLFSISLASV